MERGVAGEAPLRRRPVTDGVLPLLRTLAGALGEELRVPMQVVGRRGPGEHLLQVVGVVLRSRPVDGMFDKCAR